MYPLATMTLHVHRDAGRGYEPAHYIYEGEISMSEEQQDRLKSIIGDGLSKVTVGRDLGEKDFGSGGGVFVNVTLTCDQSDKALSAAIEMAHELANNYAWYYQQKLKQQLINAGVLKP